MGFETAVALVTTVSWVQSLAQKLPHATGAAKKKKKRNVALAKYKINRTLNIAYTIKSLHKKGHVDEKQYNIMFESKTLDLDFWNKIPALLLTKCDLGQVS